GEKLYEELMSDEETRRTVELEEMFAVMPAFRSVYEDIAYDYADIINANVTDPYISCPANSMSIESLRNYCESNSLLRPWQKNPQTPGLTIRRAA
ncbi:MAG: hypothetical protein KDA91_20425, partial [Planctomycetaceae bacterium]|nr:hypothetical protein [Planctomycetaceae bacterium]